MRRGATRTGTATPPVTGNGSTPRRTSASLAPKQKPPNSALVSTRLRRAPRRCATRWIRPKPACPSSHRGATKPSTCARWASFAPLSPPNPPLPSTDPRPMEDDMGRRPDILTPREVADEWGCSEQHVRNMVNRGDLGHFRLGGKLLRIPRSAVEAAECAVLSATTTSDGSRPLSSPEASASSPSIKRASDAGSGSAQIMRLRQNVVRQRFTPRP
ncbi:MAG: hypothetical protein CL858_29425 [Cupriavidus sp.]|nr:hypothetical protein [Methylobacterium sp.]MBU69500.1 hypothetical protein [Cupriavidus sp.]